jgi:hypothetical protein
MFATLAVLHEPVASDIGNAAFAAGASAPEAIDEPAPPSSSCRA